MSQPSLLRTAPSDLRQEAESLIKVIALDTVEVRAFEQRVAKNCFDMTIHSWRAERRLKDRATGEVKDEHRLIHRSIVGILDSLAELGFQLKDRENEPYDFGFPEKVVASDKRAGLQREIVAETIRPSVFYNGQLLREGEIIIAVPEEAALPREEAVTVTAQEPAVSLAPTAPSTTA